GRKLKLLRWRSDVGSLMTITGVVKDPSTSESLAFTALTHTGERDKDPEQITSSNYTGIYARSSQTLDTSSINKTLLKVYIDYKKALLKSRDKSFEEFYKEKNR